MEPISLLTHIGAAAAMIHQLAAGQATFNQGKYPVDNAEATAVLARVILQCVDDALEHADSG